MNPVIKILIAEDDKHDLEIIQTELKKGGINFLSEVVQNESGYRSALKNFIPDVILCDNTFPSFDGVEAFKIREEVAPQIPFILVSGTIGEENSIELIKKGVTDFVLKNKIFTLNTKLLRALKEAEERTQKNKTDKELAHSVILLARAQQVAQLGSWELNFGDEELRLSAEGARIFGLPPYQKSLSLETWSSLVHPDDIDEVLQTLQQSRDSFQDTVYHHRILLKDGTVKHIRSESKFEFDENGKAVGLYGTLQDITERKLSENKLKESELRYRSLIEQAIDVICIIDTSMKFVDMNPYACETLGYTREEALNLFLPDVLFAEDLADNPLKVNELLLGNTIRTERRFKRKNGTAVDMAVSAKIMEDGMLVMFGHDISERKKKEEQLKLLESVITNTTDSVVITEGESIDGSGVKILYVNNAFTEMTGYSAEEVIGKSPKLLQGVKSDQKELDRLREAMKIWQPCEITTINYKKSGEEYWVNFSICPVANANGWFTHWISIERDITEQKLSEIQLNDLNKNLHAQAKELALSNAELEQFAYVASHDLQEPLRMITSFLKLLKNKYEPIIDDKGRAYIGFAVDGAQRMRQIIIDLLHFSKVGRTEETLEEIDLNELVDEIRSLYRNAIKEKKALIISEPLPLVTGYRSPLLQVFQNLIGNALNYIPKDRAAKINITSAEFVDHWEFAVHDNGIGIEQEYFDKIFIIFQRLHTKDEFMGTGMGLAITKKILENEGGKIWVESEVGTGSTFYFTIKKPKKSFVVVEANKGSNNNQPRYEN